MDEFFDREAEENNIPSSSDDEMFDPSGQPLLTDRELYDDAEDYEEGMEGERSHREEEVSQQTMDIENLSQSIDLLGDGEEELRATLMKARELMMEREQRLQTTASPLRRLQRRNPTVEDEVRWQPPPLELSPECLAKLSAEEAEGLKKALTPLYLKKELQLKQERTAFQGKIWKTDPLRQPPTEAPYVKSNPVSWVLHRFIPPGWEHFKQLQHDANRTFNPFQFDPDIAEHQFRAAWLPENERTLVVRKQLLVDYMNHFVCQIIGRQKCYYIIRQADPSGLKAVYLDRKTDQKDMITYFGRKVYCQNSDEAVEGRAPKAITMGALWQDSPLHLYFHSETFDPRQFHLKLTKSHKYCSTRDEQVNTYLGWAVSASSAALYYHRLYRRLERPVQDLYEKQFFDRRPVAGWFHPIFVDRSNIVFFRELFEDDNIAFGSIITQYHALPDHPYARGPAWMRNPFWEEDHLPLMTKLRDYNLQYYFRVPPKALVGNVMSTDPAEREEEIFHMWFDNQHQPYNDAGPSVAPLLQWIWEALCQGEKEDVYIYLMNWLAVWRRSHGEIEGGNTTALILRSNPGSGKTSFVKLLGAMVGEASFYETNDCTDITGYFTTQLDEKLLLFLDEFKIAGPEAMKLKSIVTGTHVRERKMQKNAQQVHKWFSTIICANKWMVLNADPGERRFVFLELPDQLCGAKNYLTALSRSLFTAGGKFQYSRDKKYDQNFPGAGVILFAHYLDNWKLTNSVSLLQIPQNALLYIHQVASLESVASWWFDKLRAGTTLGLGAMEDWQIPQIAQQRAFLQLNDARFASQFEAEAKEVLYSADSLPAFTDKWMKKHSVGRNLDWTAVCLSLSKPLVPKNRSKLYPLISSEGDFLTKPRLLVFKQLMDGRPVGIPPQSPFRQTAKFARAKYLARLLDTSDDWQRLVWKDQLHKLYLEEAAAFRGRVELKTYTVFFNELKTLSLFQQISAAACHINLNKPFNVSSSAPVDRAQVSGLVRPLGIQPNQRSENSLPPGPQRRIYVQLDTLDNHRRAFFEFMRWDLQHWDEVWQQDISMGDTRQQKPWHLFGDKIFY